MTNVTDYPTAIKHRIRVLGAVLWPAFLTAAAATVVFFANIDPATLRAQTLPDVPISREAGYAIGFFMFWAIGTASSALTLLLLGPAPRRASCGDRTDDR